jgi:hypothetical protein
VVTSAGVTAGEVTSVESSEETESLETFLQAQDSQE